MQTSLKYTHLYLPLFLFIGIGLYLDSFNMAQILPHSQWYANLALLPVFVWIYLKSPKYLKEMMLFGIVVAIFGETLFSLILGMYTYRLGNIPLYVFFGHSVIYAAVFYLAKEPLLQIHRDAIVRFLSFGAIVYAFAWLLFGNDLFGFLCTLGLMLVLMKYKKQRLFFLLMYFTVAYLELVGTYYQCWSWPPVWFDTITFIPSANPPSGIGFFYFLFDAGCLWFYKHANKQRWKKFGAIKKAKQG